MRLAPTLVIATLLAVGLHARPGAAIDDPALRTRTTTLPNGLSVLTLEDHTTPVVSFQMWVKVFGPSSATVLASGVP